VGAWRGGRSAAERPAVRVARITKFAAPAEDGRRQEWLESALYFAAFRNHVALLQSAALRASALESHLRWLLGAVLDTQSVGSLELNDKPSRATAARIRQVPCETLKLGGRFCNPRPNPRPRRKPAANRRRRRGGGARLPRGRSPSPARQERTIKPRSRRCPRWWAFASSRA
jgi:hypothetical protein